MLFGIVCSLFLLGTSICEAGVVRDFVDCKMCERNNRNFVPSQMLPIQSTVESFVNTSFLLNLRHNASVYRILFLYYLCATLGGNNPIPNFTRRVLENLQILFQEFVDGWIDNKKDNLILSKL